MNARETIRRALRYAINDRKEYLRAWGDVPGDEGESVRTETRNEIAKFEAMMKRRYPEYCEPEYAVDSYFVVGPHPPNRPSGDEM